MRDSTKQKYEDYIKNLYELKTFQTTIAKKHEVSSAIISTLQKMKLVVRDPIANCHRYIGSYPTKELFSRIFDDIDTTNKSYQKRTLIKEEMAKIKTDINEKEAIQFLKNKGYKIYNIVTTEVPV